MINCIQSFLMVSKNTTSNFMFIHILPDILHETIQAMAGGITLLKTKLNSVDQIITFQNFRNSVIYQFSKKILTLGKRDIGL